jgi:hypothetical protein
MTSYTMGEEERKGGFKFEIQNPILILFEMQNLDLPVHITLFIDLPVHITLFVDLSVHITLFIYLYTSHFSSTLVPLNSSGAI